MLFRARLGQLERELQHPVHAYAGHHAFLHDDFSRRALEHAPANAGVFAFCVFAHDVHVDLAGLARCAVTPHHRRDDAGHETRRAQIDVLVELAPEQQQRAPQRNMVGDFVGHADRAKEDSVVAADLVFPVVRQHLAVLFKIVPAGKIEMVKLQIDTEFARRRVQHQQALGHDFCAYAVSGDDGDAVFAGHVCSLMRCETRRLSTPGS